MVDIPDDVTNAACCWALETGRWPQWYLDLKAGKATGGMPDVPKERIAEYRATIRRNLERNPHLRETHWQIFAPSADSTGR